MAIVKKHSAPLEVKFDDDAGSVRAAFARFNVKDSDGDVTLPGFFGEQEVAIVESHDNTKRVGRGRIFEDGDLAVLEGKYFLDTQQGRESYLTAKNMGDLQEWSYGFYLEDGGFRFGEHDGKQVRFLQPKDDGSPGARVAEVSTVLVGAGVGTHTVSIKSEGLRFVDQAEEVAKAAELLIARASEIQAIRASKGKTLGTDAVERIRKAMSRLEAVASMMDSIVAESVEETTTEGLDLGVLSARRVLAESQALTRR